MTLIEGQTYRFDQSDSSNNGHPLRLSTINGTHGGGSAYTTGVSTNGTPGYADAYTEITVAGDTVTLYYYCTNHSNMGSTANTFNSTVNVIGGSSVVPSSGVGTSALGDETAVPSIEVIATTNLGTTNVGTLAIVIDTVVLSTGVSATGGTGE